MTKINNSNIHKNMPNLMKQLIKTLIDQVEGDGMETIGFIGLGNMGGGMSANIQRAG